MSVKGGIDGLSAHTHAPHRLRLCNGVRLGRDLDVVIVKQRDGAGDVAGAAGSAGQRI